MITRAMLMTAGLGTRLRPYTGVLPKPLLPLLGVPMAQFALDGLVDAGVRRIVANVHHLPELTRSGLAGLERGQAELVLSDESQLLLGSAGGIRKALDQFEGEPFFYANADVLCPVDWAELGKRHEELNRSHGVRLTLLLLPRGPAGEKYREIQVDSERMRVSALGEPREGAPFFAGAAVFDPAAFSGLPLEKPSDFVADVLRQEVAAGRVGVAWGQGEWMDIGSPELWHRAHLQCVEKRATLPPLWRQRLEFGQKVEEQRPGVWKGAGFQVDLANRQVIYGASGTQSGPGISFNGIWTKCP